ncbi:DUF4837 family protein [Flavobacterium sp.]|uniref:DUF4837 family protein n=1 Tax=Flavobacterium sp. TaxID=239 RepID=UPI00286B66BB|nr:DUF4837 family protein [Flavobacterium sp.]
MNKTLFSILFISLFLFSCNKKEDLLIRQSTGKINTISIIIEDQLWEGEIGDNIRNKFASPVLGLPQEEPLFTINQYSTAFLEGFVTDSRTIIVVKIEAKTKFEIKKNQYASPQNVFHISGKSTREIVKILDKNTPKIIKIIKESEVLENQRIINQFLLDSKIIYNKFHVSLKIPSDYTYVMHKSNFMWLKKEIISGNNNLLLYEVPIRTIQNDLNIVSNIIKMRDSIGTLYISGTGTNTPMITDEGYAPYHFKIKLDGKDAFETKGTWELKNDYMSGSFVNYVIIDEPNNRALILEGFCYSPSNEKRDLMFELEAIIKSVVVNKK